MLRLTARGLWIPAFAGMTGVLYTASDRDVKLKSRTFIAGISIW